MDWTILAIFIFVYVGMILGRIPGLALDRTGVALLGGIALIVANKVTTADAWSAVDVPTISLLFGLMVVSAQFRLGGFYTEVARRLAAAKLGPRGLLALLIAVAGGLSALLTNDIVCLAMTPVLINGCAKRRLNPLPYCLALACAANVGSAATLIGNPQNILIGQALNLSFGRYLLDAGVPALIGLVAVWVVIAWRFRGQWECETKVVDAASPALRLWHAAKAGLLLIGLVAAFLFTPLPREMLALGAAGAIMLSRRFASRDILADVDWQLLVLFIGLFIVNHALAAPTAQGVRMLDTAMARVREAGVDPSKPAELFVMSTLLSNVVSNVPAVMLLLPSATHPLAGPILALSSTLAGNLFLVGSIANIIVAKEAAPLGVTIDWKTHARVGVPVTLLTLAIAAAWLALRA